MRKKLVVAGVIVLAGIAAAGWFGYKPVLVRHHVGRLASGDEAAIGRVAELGEPAQPRLIELMKQESPAAGRAGQAMARMLEIWPKDDPRCARLGERVAGALGEMSPAGQQAALKLAEAMPGRDAAGRIVQAALKDGQAAVKEQAILLAMKPEFNLGPAVAPLLKDPHPEVRRCALEAVGSSRDLAADEELLPLLHDADADVRGLCEAALRGRGLRAKDIRLGRLLADPSPLKRLEVIQFLPADAELDPQVWLQKLCQDPSPAVRATAARTAMDPASRFDVDMTDRIRQMAQNDPDGTVRQIADYLIRSQKKNEE